MRHLLEHTKSQIQRELEIVENPKLEYVYEDMLDKIDAALAEIDSGSDWGAPYEDSPVPSEDPFDKDRYAHSTNRFGDMPGEFHDTGTDGLRDEPIGDFDPDMGQFDTDRLQDLAGISGEDLDPRDMNEDQFQKLLARLRPDLVSWATGKEGFENRFDKEEVTERIQSALHKAKSDSEGTVDMLRTFHEQVSDNLFDASQNFDSE